MKCSNSLFSGPSTQSICTNKPTSKNKLNVTEKIENYINHSFLKDLEEQGFCVIPRVLSSIETKHLYERVWHEFIEKAWPNCKMDERGNWKETFPMHDKSGIFTGPAGQIQVMWDLRQDPRIVNIFAQIWNTQDLIVSMDGLSLMCPIEIREGSIDPWPHVDQAVLRRQDNCAHSNNPPEGFESESSLVTKPYTIQGQFLFEDSAEGDGGFYCIPKSHLKFSEFAPKLEAINELNISRDKKRQMRKNVINEFFDLNFKDSEKPYSNTHIQAPKGSLILWDSRTIHWNQHANKDRTLIKELKVRMVGYICYVPKSRLSNEGKALREEAFLKGVATGHNPANPELKYTKDFISPEFTHYFEDINYKQSTIILSSLGKSVLGI